jgi:hypothetical protein
MQCHRIEPRYSILIEVLNQNFLCIYLTVYPFNLGLLSQRRIEVLFDLGVDHGSQLVRIINSQGCILPP